MFLPPNFRGLALGLVAVGNCHLKHSEVAMENFGLEEYLSGIHYVRSANIHHKLRNSLKEAIQPALG